MKKLIPALCMLLVAASLLGTSTYAWFSMNETVTAQGMKVTAISDSKFLQIRASTATWNNNDPFTEVTFSASEVPALKPTHPATSLSDQTMTPFSTGAAAPVWVTAFSANPNESTAKYGTYAQITGNIETAGYALMESVVVRLKPSSNSANSSITASDLKVTGVKITPVGDAADALAPALRVLFECGSKRVLWAPGDDKISGTADDVFTGSSNAVLVPSLSTGDTEITIYVFYDGTDSACTTNNALDPKQYTVDFSLGFANSVNTPG